MKAQIASTIALGVASLMPAPVFAGHFMDGNKLYDLCTAQGHPMLEGACSGYIMGVADDLAGINDVMPTAACLPENVTTEQAHDIVVGFLRDHPEKRHFTAEYLVGIALNGAFPCPKASRPGPK